MKIIIPLDSSFLGASQSITQQDDWLTIPLWRLSSNQYEMQKKEMALLKKEIESLQKKTKALTSKLAECEKKNSSRKKLQKSL